MSGNYFVQPIGQISVEELAQRLKRDTPQLQLLDVREPQEVEIASIEGFVNLPLSKHDKWAQQIHENLDPHLETLVLCHHGIRSAHMCQWLISQGFTEVKNIVGGIDAYSQNIDHSIPQY